MPKPTKKDTGPASKVRPADSEDEAGTYSEDRYGGTDTGESDSGVTAPGTPVRTKVVQGKPVTAGRPAERKRKSSGEDNPTA